MYLIGIGFLGFISILSKDFILTRPQPWKEPFINLNPVLAYVSGIALILTAVCVMTHRFRRASLLIIINLILFLATSRHIINLWRDYINGFKSLVLISGALLILAELNPSSKNKKLLLWTTLVSLFMFFATCAYAHFTLAVFVQELIPKFIPFRLFFTYFAGVCLFLGGLGFVLPKTQKLAALLSGIMITGWFFLLHIPRAFTEINVLSECIGVGESFSIAGICFMVYGILNVEKKQNL